MRIPRRAAALLLVPTLTVAAPLPSALAADRAHAPTQGAERSAAAARAATLTLTAPASAFTRSKLTLTGRASVRSKARVVRLDVRRAGRWTKVATRRTTAAGRFSITVNTPAAATRRHYRVTVFASGTLPRERAQRTVTIRKAPPAAQTPTPKPADFAAVWQRRTLTLGSASQFTASGTVPGPTGRNRKVVLQRRHADSWKTVARSTTDAAGKFRLAAPAEWLVNLEHRVYVPATSKARKRFSQATRLVVSPSWRPRGSSTDWTALRTPRTPDSAPVRYRWDSCQGAITYRVNKAQAPSFVTQTEIAAVMHEVAQATGLQFTYAGTTSAHAFGRAGSSWPSDTDLVISWTRPSQTSQKFGSARVVGLGGAEGVAARDARGAVAAITRGHVIVRVGSPYLTAADEAETWQVLKHEVAHATGLGHARTSGGKQLMGSTLRSDGDRAWGKGDLAGLRRVGATEGCMKYPTWFGTTLGAVTPDDRTPLVVLP